MTKNALLMTTVAGGLLLGLYLAWSGSAATPPVGTDPKSSGTRAAPDNASRTGQETTRTRPPEAAKPSTGARGPFESLSHVLAAHLTPAPEDAQAAAATLFEQQARHFEEQAADALSTESLRGVMHAIDCEFSATLRREAAEQLRRGEGLLVVNGNDYSKRIAGKQWLLWGGGLRYHGKGVEVLVVFDVPSAKLAELDRSLRQARAVFLASATSCTERTFLYLTSWSAPRLDLT